MRDAAVDMRIEIEQHTMRQVRLMEDQQESKYSKYRGKCKEYCEAARKDDPTLILVRGHYHCPLWGEQPHWWLKREDGTIVDPTVEQFPAPGAGEYVEFDGMVNCSECGREMREEDATFDSNYCFCCGNCHMRFVGMGAYCTPCGAWKPLENKEGPSHE